MQGIEYTIQKIGKEVDKDILDWMMGVSKTEPDYTNGLLLNDPVMVMLEWQKLRDRKKDAAIKLLNL